MANAHLAYPDLALDKFSGTDPDQDAEAFIRLIECKINFALEPNQKQPTSNMLFIYSERKPYSPRYYGYQQPNGMGALFKMQ